MMGNSRAVQTVPLARNVLRVSPHWNQLLSFKHCKL